MVQAYAYEVQWTMVYACFQCEFLSYLVLPIEVFLRTTLHFERHLMVRKVCLVCEGDPTSVFVFNGGFV